MSDEPIPKVQYFVGCRDGDFVLELPSTWRLTFASVNPAAPMGGRDLHCLRVWDGPTKGAKLQAVFCNVSGFRNLSLPLARKNVRETGSATWTRDDNETLFSEKRQLESEWTDARPDDVPF